GFNRFEEKAEPERVEKVLRLLEVRAVAEIQGERFEPRGVQPQPLHDVISGEKHRSAVDAAGETDAERRPGVNRAQPLGDLLRHRANVAAADFIEIRRERVARRIEKARISWVRVGTTDELNLDDMMRRDHSRVARMKLAGKSFALEPLVDGVDAI